MKIHIVIYESWDGDGLIRNILKAFEEKSDAEEFVNLCNKECKRILSEVKEHNEKYEKELLLMSDVVRDLILENGRKKKPEMIDFSKLPESQRRQEINNISRSIFKSHKYDTEFMDFDNEYEYIIEEVELT